MKKKLIPGVIGSVLSAAITAPTTYALSSSQPQQDEKLVKKQHELLDLEIKKLKGEIREQERLDNCRMYIRMSMNDENIKRYCKKQVQNIGGDSYSE